MASTPRKVLFFELVIEAVLGTSVRAGFGAWPACTGIGFAALLLLRYPAIFVLSFSNSSRH